jgi:CRP/FNR family transcriptional regulator, cyclic AMP receptor protein
VASTSLFDLLPEDERRVLLASARRRRFQRRDTIFHEGDPGDTMHVIVSGLVSIRATTSMGDVVTLTVLGPDESFGELAAIGHGAPRAASAVAATAVETLGIGREPLDEVRDRHPRVDRFIIEVLARQVRRLDQQLIEALHVPAEKRIMRRLLLLGDICGDDGGGPLPFTQEDIASMAGTTRPTVNRVLTRLREAELVEIGRGHVTVVDRAAIERRAR